MGGLDSHWLLLEPLFVDYEDTEGLPTTPLSVVVRLRRATLVVDLVERGRPDALLDLSLLISLRYRGQDASKALEVVSGATLDVPADSTLDVALCERQSDGRAKLWRKCCDGSKELVTCDCTAAAFRAHSPSQIAGDSFSRYIYIYIFGNCVFPRLEV